MKKTFLYIISLTSIIIFTGCNIPRDVPRIDNTFSIESTDISQSMDNEVNTTINNKNNNVAESDNKETQRVGKDIYGFINIPLDWSMLLEKTAEVDLLQYTNGDGEVITIYPYRRAEMIGNAEKMRTLYKEMYVKDGSEIVGEETLVIDNNTFYALYLKYSGEDETHYKSAALYLADELIENNIKDKDYLKYIFIESNKENHIELFNIIKTYNLFDNNIETKTNNNNTLFAKENVSDGLRTENLVELQNKNTLISLIPPKDYRVVVQDKFVALLTNDKYDVITTFSNDTETDYIRKSALEKYEKYKKQYLDYDNVDISNDKIKINEQYTASHYLVSYLYKELNIKYEYHYYLFQLDNGLYVVEVLNHENNNFKDFKIEDFLNIK